jgi:hypothetical protein
MERFQLSSQVMYDESPILDFPAGFGQATVICPGSEPAAISSEANVFAPTNQAFNKLPAGG